jgi:hypothetical protein
LIYLRRRNSRVLSVTLSAEDNQKIDALLNNAGKEGKDS